MDAQLTVSHPPDRRVGNTTSAPSTPTRPSRFAASTGRCSRCRISATACAAPRTSGRSWSTRVEAIPGIPRPRARESAGGQAGGQRARLAHGAAERHRIERRKRGVLPAHAPRNRLRLHRQPAVRPDAAAAVESRRGERARPQSWQAASPTFLQRIDATAYQATAARIVLPRAPKSTNGACGNVFGDTRSAEELYEYGAQQVALYSRLIQEVVATIAKDAGLGASTTRDVIDHLAKRFAAGTMTSCLRGIAKRPRAPSRTAASTACSTCPRTTSSTFCRRRRSSQTASTPRTTWRRRSRNRASAVSISRRPATTRRS